ncbi:MAG: PTS sugar transporter subunit IIA [Fibrobacteria bacterium]|nr:PTS sugar transporter subunit IIA [Fibrobacteria bacterium]
MRLTDRFSEEGIIIDSPASTKKEIIEVLVDKLCEVYAIENKEGVHEAVLGREKKMSTGIGCGLAVPHTKIDIVNKMCIVAATSTKGINFDAIDKEPVFLLFLIVSPTNTTGPHIRALSAISRIMSDAEIRKSLIASQAASEFYQQLRLGEEKYT